MEDQITLNDTIPAVEAPAVEAPVPTVKEQVDVIKANIKQATDAVKAMKELVKALTADAKAKLAVFQGLPEDSAVEDVEQAEIAAHEAETKREEAATRLAASEQWIKDARAQIKSMQEAAKAERAAAKEARAEKVAKPKVERIYSNGVRMPLPDSKCGAAWALFDNMTAELGRVVTIGEAVTVGAAEGQNEGNIRVEHSFWRKFYGHPTVGRGPAKEKPAAPEAAPAAAPVDPTVDPSMGIPDFQPAD